MGQCGGHLGSIPYRRLPSRPSGKASPETSWKTPASVASSRQEPLTGGGDEHDTNSAAVAPSDHHQREPSPEY